MPRPRVARRASAPRRARSWYRPRHSRCIFERPATEVHVADPHSLRGVTPGSRNRRRLTHVPFAVEPSDGPAPPVAYRWDADTEILSASVADVRGGGSVATSVELEGRDGSWVTLELRAGRLCGVEVAVWPPIKARSSLVPPTAPTTGHLVYLGAVGVAGAADVEVDTLLSAESDRMERTFHVHVGTPRRVRAVRVGHD